MLKIRFKNLLFVFLIALPVPVFAHGQEVLVSLFYDFITCIAIVIFILLIQWNSKGKTLLGTVLFLSVILIFSVTAQWPYTENRRLIELLCCGVPLFGVLLCYVLFRKKFSKKNPPAS